MAEPSAPRDLLDPSPEREPDRPVSRRAVVALALAGAVIGWAMIGIDGALVAPAVVVAGWTWRREPGRPIGTAAVVLLVVAAVATVVEVTPDPDAIGVAFSRRRPVAARTAAMAGVLLAVALLAFGFTERSRTKALRRPLVGGRVLRSSDTRATTLRSTAIAAAPWAAIGFAAIAVRMIASPARLPTAMVGLITNLRYGSLYAVGPIWQGPTADIPPLGAALLAYGPFGSRLAVVLASTAAALVAARIAYVQLGRTGAIATALVAALLPSMWSQPLPLVLAGLAAAGAVAVADPERVDGRRASVAGVLAGLAMLAAPDAVVVLPCLVAWHVLSAPRSQRHLALAMAGAGVLTMGPWLAYVGGTAGVPVPAGTWSGFVLEGLATPSLPLVASFAVGAAALVLAARELRAARDAWRQLLPFVVLPAWNVVMAVAAGGDRDLLGWSAPLVAVVLGSALCAWYEGSSSRPAPTSSATEDHLFA